MGMKSISKIIALLGMIAMLFTMVGCPNANAGGGEPPQPTAPTNNFKGKYFVGTLENGSEFGYALFSDKGVTLKTVKLIDCSYTFNEDVATITGTYGEQTVTLTTTKLEGNKFTITYSKDLTGEEKDLVVTYTKATKPSTNPYSGKFFAGYIVETDGVATPEETAIMYFDFESKTVTPYMYIEDSFMQINDALAFTVDSKDLTDVKVTVNWVDEEESLEITSMGYDAKTESFKVDVPAALFEIDDAETFTIEFKKATKPEIPEVEEPELPYTVSFQNSGDGHSATVSEEGVITITLAEKAAGGDWDNQIFIEGVNGDTIVADAKICTSFTITSSIDMPKFYVKNQFADDYTGIDKTVPLTAEEATEVKIYGIVSGSYKADQEKFLIALRDNMVAGATLTISGLESKVITDEEYQAYLDSLVAGTKNADVFLKDGTVNTIAGTAFWWANDGNGAWGVEDANLEGASVKKVTTLLSGDCGCFNVAEVPFRAGAKVTVEVYSETETSVAFKPVAPNLDSDVYSIPAGEWTTITLGLGDTPASLTQLGVIAKADGCVVYIGDIKVIDNE